MHRKLLWSVVGICFSVVGVRADVTGTVKYDGKTPATVTIPMPANQPHCQKMAQKNPITKEDMPIVAKDGGLKNVFVQVKSGLPKGKNWETPKTPVVLTQEGCHYVPHVFGVMEKQGVEVVNGDSTNHNIHGLPKKNKEFNFSQAQKGMKKVVELDKLEDFRIKCDVHEWMNAHCFVMSHPFFAVTDAEGKYTIKDLPDGEYELEFWHETLGTQTAKVKVSGGKATADAKFKPKARGPIPKK